MAVDRAHQVRVVVVPEPPAALAPVRAAVRRVLGAGWQVQRLTAGSRMLVVTGESAATVGSDEHARESHEAALALIRSGRFRRVEADVPVPAFEERQGVGAFGGDQCGDDSTPLDWAHKTVRWQQAMDLMSAATRGGVGIRIGHPDSGYTLHPNLGAAALDLTTDRDVIDNDDDAVDDLTPNPLWPLPNPGHGTATASVIVGRGTAAAGIVGLAPAAVLVPIRATESVVQLFDSDVARAVAHARAAGCHIVSMSLGGKGFFGLEDEIQKAVDSGMIVMAAAGNHVRIVTAPASYANCLAVAATGPGDSRWDGSSRGPAVDVSMPGACVHNASYNNDKQPEVRAATAPPTRSRTWPARRRSGSPTTATPSSSPGSAPSACRPPSWPCCAGRECAWCRPAGTSTGGSDASTCRRCCRRRCRPRPSSTGVGAFGATESDAVGRIAASIGVEPVLVRTRLAAMLGADTPEELARLLVEHEGELVYLTMVDAAFADSLVQPGGVGAFAPAPLVGGVSAELAGSAGRLTGVGSR